MTIHEDGYEDLWIGEAILHAIGWERYPGRLPEEYEKEPQSPLVHQSEFENVHWHKGAWVAQVRYGTHTWIKRFPNTPEGEQAAAAQAVQWRRERDNLRQQTRRRKAA